MVLCLKTRESRSLPGLLSTQIINIFSIPCKTVHICAKRENNPYRIKFYHLDAGWSSPVARQAHNLKAAGSNPTPATKIMPASCGPFFYQKSKIRNKPKRPPSKTHPSSMCTQAQCAPKTGSKQPVKQSAINVPPRQHSLPIKKNMDSAKKMKIPCSACDHQHRCNLCSARDENNPTSEEQPR